jgi:GTP diphosphokinase / guanosine-3',5'-bis(diphosphate) 3'-diphosphatase
VADLSGVRLGANPPLSTYTPDPELTELGSRAEYPPGVCDAPVEPGLFLVSDLCNLLDTYLEPQQVREIYRAYLFGAEAHEGQCRLSGEPYIFHPIAVARILAEMRLDHHSIVAALLHDVMEDTLTAKDQLAQAFGQEVAELVDGVTKITQIAFESRAEAQAENFRKMLLAMAQDMRVIIIKLADRLHNMRTLGAMPSPKRRRIARETLEIYAPIAYRLGMNALRVELEELGFCALYPMRCRVLRKALAKARANRKEVVDKIEAALKGRLRQEDLEGRVLAQEKHLYSMYRKMRSKGVSFEDVSDLYAFHIIADNVDTCYRVLGAVHNLYKPVPGKFKDYIAIPKVNGYQALHSVLLGPYGVHVEVQIRTGDMDRVASAGITAQWPYDTRGTPVSNAQQRVREWLRGLLEMQKGAGNSVEFLENVKVDLFPQEVYVFTPLGEIKVLPRGATAVDFAYAVHTDVGNTCVAARVDRRLAPLHTQLLNGQSVEIITAPGGKPKPSWLNFVVTAKARANIRHYLKNLQRGEAVDLGRRLLEKELATLSLCLADIPAERLGAVLQEFRLASVEQLFEDTGLGKRLAPLVARRLASEPEARGKPPEDTASGPLAIKGTEGMVVTFAKCCRPIPGDPIVGFVSAGRGIVIHSPSCKNVAEYRQHPEKWLNVQWEPQVVGEFPVDIRVEVANQRGVLASVAAAIAEVEANIDNVSITERDGLYTTLNFTVAVRSRQHLARIIRRVRAGRMVVRIYRAKA